jgi:hypothetical protein
LSLVAAANPLRRMRPFSSLAKSFPPFLSMHVLIAPDKFKGSLTAAQAAAALAKGWREGWPVDKPLKIECLPVADGGEGTAEAIHDAFGRPLDRA